MLGRGLRPSSKKYLGQVEYTLIEHRCVAIPVGTEYERMAGMLVTISRCGNSLVGGEMRLRCDRWRGSSGPIAVWNQGPKHPKKTDDGIWNGDRSGREAGVGHGVWVPWCAKDGAKAITVLVACARCGPRRRSRAEAATKKDSTLIFAIEVHHRVVPPAKSAENATS